MTETLGWGDVDVDEAPRRRRRLPAAPVWAAVAVVVAGVALWPTAKDTLVDRSAKWLQREWVTAQAYDGSRLNIEEKALDRLATGDTPLMLRIIQDLDREQAARLTALARDVTHHHYWAASVSSVARTARQAMLAEAASLRADSSAASTGSSRLDELGYPPDPMSPTAYDLRTRTEAQLGRLMTARHLKGQPKVTVALTSADQLVAQLARVTSKPLGMRLAVMHNSQLDVWDLRSGAVRRNVIGDLPDGAPTGTLPVIGSSLLAQFNANWWLWPLDGPRPIQLPSVGGNGFYEPAGDVGLWRTEDNRIRRYDASGRPMGGWHDYPAGTQQGYVSAATPDAVLVVIQAGQFGDFTMKLWYPETGRLVALPRDPCLIGPAAAASTIAYLPCDPKSVTVTDARSGRVRSLRLPRGFTASGGNLLLSPDATTLVVPANPVSAPDGPPTTLLIANLRTGGVTRLDTPAAPLAWSPDGSTLLLDVNGNDPSAPAATATGFAPLAYWQPGMTQLAGIRINLVDGEFGVALLP